MTGAAGPTDVRPLLPGDPRQMGLYELTGRLGEGGMGTVYLARTPEGRHVAVKVIKADLAGDPEFRQRFRSEFERAQEVPPFCTAEVLDADPDHEQPYLVVEYVPGPSLAAVVAEQGPLTSSNLHGLAIGVATALTAIHGAGVIHRDLKPSNVLLSPGSPKVIDFGIARAVEGAATFTRTDQMVGTVTYMAPERFENTRLVTPAADIFAWGAVIAYAGTGRNPFAADMPHMVAVRILTMPPELDGLTGPLRELVELALSKDPADRPTARELLDRLLVTGPHRAGSAAAVLNRQPALRDAVAEARAADDGHGVEPTAAAQAIPGEATTRFGLSAASPPGSPVSASPVSASPVSASPVSASPVAAGLVAAGPAPAAAVPAGYASTEFITPGPAVFGGGADPTVAVAGPASTGWGVAGPAASAPAAGGREAEKPRNKSARVAVALLAGTAVLAVAVLAGVASGLIPLNQAGGSTGATGPSAPAAASATPSVGPPVIIADPLTSEQDWRVVDDPDNEASCGFDDALVVQKESPGPYRCPGPRRLLTDFTLTVTTRLLTRSGCAGIWLRFDKIDAKSTQEAGYVLLVCSDRYRLMTHGIDGAGEMNQLASFPYSEPLAQRKPVAVGVTADGPRLTFTRDGAELGTWKDTMFTRGRVVLGILNMASTGPAARVSFTDITIRA